MASPFVVSVAQIQRVVPSKIHVTFRGPFDEAHEFEPRPPAETDVPADSEVDVDVRIESFSGGLRVRGTVLAPWRAICRRCSEIVNGQVDVAVNERFVENPPPEDEEAYPFTRDSIDLLPMVHDAVLLELPIAPLCRPDCKGLCPMCGIDRNEAICDCQPDADPRWDTLDALRFEDPASD